MSALNCPAQAQRWAAAVDFGSPASAWSREMLDEAAAARAQGRQPSMANVRNLARLIDGAANQYRALYRTMACSVFRYHMHVGSAGYVLLIDGAPMDVALPIAVRDVHAMSEPQLRERLAIDARTRVWEVAP